MMLKVATLKAALYAVPGANYVLIAWEFIKRYWKPIALAAALVYTFNAGKKYERKKHDVAQLTARLAKATFERDNLEKSAESTNATVTQLESEAAQLRSRVDELSSKPVVGDCTLSDDALRRLRRITAD